MGYDRAVSLGGRLVGLLSLLLALAVAPTGDAVAAPKKKGGGGALAQQQLEYAKQLYKEGLEALEAKDYETATTKFEEAYRYAPDKHSFNFNIAGAALAAGDCLKAQRHYQQFLDLVHEHPERRTAKAKLKQIARRKCARAAEDAPELGKRSRDPPEVVADKQALYPALEAARYAAALYRQVVVHHGGAKPFKGIARAKGRHARRLERTILKLGYDVPERTLDVGRIPVGGTLKEACGQAVQQEPRNIALYEKGLEHFTDGPGRKTFLALLRAARKRHLPAFERCTKGE